MATIEDMASMLADESGLVTVATIRSNGEPLLSIVNAGVIDHPSTGSPVVAFVSGGSAVRLRHIRSRGHLSVLARRGPRWLNASGTAELIGPDDHPDALDATNTDLAHLLRAIFESAGGTHDDWNEFDRAMVADRRCAVLMSPLRINSN